MSIICANCGASISEGKKFCAACGAKVEEVNAAPQPAMAAAAAQPAYASAPAQKAISPETAFGPPPPKGSPYAVISTLGYVGYFLVMALPIIGLVLTIIWAFSKNGSRNGSRNRRNLARAMLVFLVLALALAIFAVISFWPIISQAMNFSANYAIY